MQNHEGHFIVSYIMYKYEVDLGCHAKLREEKRRPTIPWTEWETEVVYHQMSDRNTGKSTVLSFTKEPAAKSWG